MIDKSIRDAIEVGLEGDPSESRRMFSEAYKSIDIDEREKVRSMMKGWFHVIGLTDENYNSTKQPELF